MRSKADLVRGWLRKAESDLANLEVCLQAGVSLDTACFHAQQAAEKVIKAYLTAQDIDFPFIHNLEKLIELCALVDPAFLEMKSLGEQLTPFAVELRYDDEFWPDEDTVGSARLAAISIKDFVMKRLSGYT